MHKTTQGGRIAPQMILIVVAALAVALGLWAGARWFAPASAPAPAIALQSGLVYPTPRVLPEFSLRQSDGSELTRAELEGRWTLVFFGFTHCPDICPTTLALLAEAERRWQSLPEADRPRILFVSVDPERDTPERAGEYAAWFSPTVLAATGEHGQLQPFARALGMVYMQAPLDDGGYTVDHSASVAVLDPQARLRAVMRPPLDPALVAADMLALAGDGA